MSNKYHQRVLKASSYYLEDVLELNLDKRAKEGKLSFILLNQPPICDAHCRRCFMPEERRRLGAKYALSLNESKKVLDDAREYGALCLEISGEGEPTLNKDLPGLIAHAHKLGYLTTLITNGHSLTQEQIVSYRDSGVTLIFSHHSLNSSKYESDNGTSGKGSFEKKMKNLDIAIEAYKGTTENINNIEVHRLAIHATLQKDNVQDTLDLRDYCHSKGIFFSVAPLAQLGCAIDHPEMKLEETVEINGNAVPLVKVPDILGDNSIIHSHSSAREIGKEVCGTCFYGASIGYDGNLLFDAHCGYEIGDKFGNVRTTPFSDIIKIQRAISQKLFQNIDGFCPARDPKWNNFLKKVLDEKVRF